MSVTSLKKPATKVVTLGGAIDELWGLREQKREADAVVKEIEAAIKAKEATMFELLDAQETNKGEGRRASISMSLTTVANTTDWTEFMKFVAAGKRGDKSAYLHLVQKRVSDPAYRELLELGVSVPGLQPFTKRTLNLRTLNV